MSILWLWGAIELGEPAIDAADAQQAVRPMKIEWDTHCPRCGKPFESHSETLSRPQNRVGLGGQVRCLSGHRFRFSDLRAPRVGSEEGSLAEFALVKKGQGAFFKFEAFPKNASRAHDFRRLMQELASDPGVLLTWVNDQHVVIAVADFERVSEAHRALQDKLRLMSVNWLEAVSIDPILFGG